MLAVDLKESQFTATLPTNPKKPLYEDYSMGRLSDRLGDLIERLKESDRLLQELTERHLADTKKALNRLEEIAQAD